MKSRIISAILILALLLSLSVVICSAKETKSLDFGTGGAIEEKIKEILTVYDSDSYFTVSGNPCYSSQSYDCQLSQIPKRGNLPSGEETAKECLEAWSCCSFARYVFYNIFNCDPEKQTRVDKDNLSYGDFIFMSNRHYAIYLGEDDNNYYVYHANGDGQCGVEYMDALDKDTWNISFAYHADNYKKFDGNFTVADEPSLPKLNCTKDGIKISWNYVQDVENYKILRRSSKDLFTEYKEIAKVSSDNSYLDTDVKSGNTYFYTIQSLNGKKEAVSSYNKNGNSIYYIASPKVLTEYNKSHNNSTISWDYVEGAKTYSVYYKENKEDGYKSLCNSTKNQFCIQNDINLDSTYTYLVIAKTDEETKSSNENTIKVNYKNN